MLKKTLAAALFLAAGSAAAADSDLSISQLATAQSTKAEFARMVEGHKLPAWVTKGGTRTGTKEVQLGENRYLVLESCKPHDCGSERIAVLYSPKLKRMMGLYSTVDEAKSIETLTWLNVGDAESIDGKTVLYAALTGSLENHPDAFSFK
ncbi:C-lysozyme inhibitor [Erwinia sp. CPCC 100877]|nr:C-lysozyme inhibitor [Erwinia sp. CPCC 100877]